MRLNPKERRDAVDICQPDTSVFIEELIEPRLVVTTPRGKGGLVFPARRQQRADVFPKDCKRFDGELLARHGLLYW